MNSKKLLLIGSLLAIGGIAHQTEAKKYILPWRVCKAVQADVLDCLNSENRNEKWSPCVDYERELFYKGNPTLEQKKEADDAFKLLAQKHCRWPFIRFGVKGGVKAAVRKYENDC